jgi:magnesium transporter
MLTIKCGYSRSRVEEIPLEGALEIIRRGDTPLWFDLDTPTQAELDFLEKELQIHQLTVEDIINQHQRPKIESFEEYVYLAIQPLVRKQNLEIEPAEVDLLLGHNWLVMVHYGPIPGLESSLFTERLNPALIRGADFLLYTIVDLIVDSYFPILDEIDEEIEWKNRD